MAHLIFKNNDNRNDFLTTRMPKSLLVFNIALAIVYFIALIFVFERGNYVLFWLLVAGQIFHLWQLFTFIYTIWDTEHKIPANPSFRPEVDVFITVAGEPADVVEETARAALSMRYPNFRVFILNDGYVAKKANWRDMEELAHRLGIHCITRTTPGGAKAGNINHALSLTHSTLVAIFDADHVPHEDFLEKMTGYFADPRVAFVQSPQYYKNNPLNQITAGAWEQQELWFGPLCKGKNRLNAVSMCGTNMVIRRKALEEVNGMCTESIAEDFITGLFMHARGWKSVYVPEVLAEGLAPEDFLSYYKQQFRWARGSLDAIFRYNIFFRRGLTLAQRIQYLSSASFFLSGLIVLLNALIPIVYFFTGLIPLTITTMALAAVFLPYIFITLYTLQRSSHFTFTFRSLAFSMAGFNIHISAMIAALLRRKSPFAVTSKRGVEGNFLYLVIPHLLYIAAFAVGLGVALAREGFSPSLLSNMAWGMLNIAIFMEFIKAALPQRSVAPKLVRAPSAVRS
jgi:cellulose synthase (UDP-forming)